MKAKCAQLGFDVVANSPEQFAAYIKAEVEKWGQGDRAKRRSQIKYASQASKAVSRVKIVDIRETAIPLKSTLANSSFNFSEMTTSVVAVITDVMRGGKPVTGFAFNSTGRYACGAQMRERFIPRILQERPGHAARRGRRLCRPTRSSPR